jgi:hypothetical protein
MASTLSHHRRRPARSLQAFLVSGLVGAALLAIAGVTTMTAAVTDAVRGPQAEIVPPAGDLPSIAAAAYVRTPYRQRRTPTPRSNAKDRICSSRRRNHARSRRRGKGAAGAAPFPAS